MRVSRARVGVAVIVGLGLAAPAQGQAPADGARMGVTIPGTELELTLIFVPPGSFGLGSPAAEAGRDRDEGPVRRVSLDGFWMTETEVTHDQFDPFRARRLDSEVGPGGSSFDADAVTRPSPPYEDPSHGMERGPHPATGMTRTAALHYARWLSEKTGRLFTLPSEAQWEYACRAGVGGGSFAGGTPEDELDAIAWFEANADGTYHPVRAKDPNAWGLHDMSGNVAEWVLDEYTAGAYTQLGDGALNPVAGRPGRGRGIVRGGAFDDPPDRLRCAERFPEATAWKARDPQMPKSSWWNTDSPHVGFRLVSPARPYDLAEIRAYWSALLAG